MLATQGDLRRWVVLDDWEFRSAGMMRYHDEKECLCEVDIVLTLRRVGIRVQVPREDDVFDFVQV